MLFSITTPGHWNSELAEKIIDEQNTLFELRSQNDIELNVEKNRKKGYFFKMSTLYPVLVLLKLKYWKN